MPLALDDYSEDGALSFGDTMSADIQLDLRPVKPQLISTLKEMVPPEYLEENARVFIDALVPYLAKDTDSFVVEIPISDRITAAGAALKTLTADDRVIEFLYDEFSLEIAMEVIKDGITFDLDVTAQDLVDAVRGTAPDDWLQQQLTLAVDSITPYLAGESETFSILVPVNERIDDARAELKALLSNWDARTYIFAEIVDPGVNASIGAGIPVPFQLTVTPQDVKSALREVLSRDWADRRVAELVDTTVDYASGRRETFRLEVPLHDRKAVAMTRVGRLMESRLEALFPTIPVCTQQQLASINVQDFPRTGIVCRPPSHGPLRHQGHYGPRGLRQARGSPGERRTTRHLFVQRSRPALHTPATPVGPVAGRSRVAPGRLFLHPGRPRGSPREGRLPQGSPRLR